METLHFDCEDLGNGDASLSSQLLAFNDRDFLQSIEHMTRTKQNFVIAVASSSTTTAAPLEWHVPRPLPCVTPPRQRVASSPHLATNSPFALIPTCLTGTSATLMTSYR